MNLTLSSLCTAGVGDSFPGLGAKSTSEGRSAGQVGQASQESSGSSSSLTDRAGASTRGAEAGFPLHPLRDRAAVGFLALLGAVSPQQDVLAVEGNAGLTGGVPAVARDAR
jgi:hypothetical protein